MIMQFLGSCGLGSHTVKEKGLISFVIDSVCQGLTTTWNVS